MINVLVPIVENVDGFVSFIERNKSSKVKFYIGVTQSLSKKLPKMSGVDVRVFKNGSGREEIINAFHNIKMKKGKIMIVRRPLSEEEFSALISSSADVASLKKPRNKFVSFFRNIIKKIVKRMFAFSVFDDISAICFGEFLFELISVCSNLSVASRINKYVGVEFEEIETKNKQAKILYNRFANFLTFFAGLMFFLGSIASGILIFIFAKRLLIIYVMLIVLWWVVAFFVFFYTIVVSARTTAVGVMNYEPAKEIIISKKGDIK